MTDTQEFSLETARAAAERDELNDWVAGFLSTPDSDNAPLGAELTDPPRCWLGPVEVPLDQLHRLAGPPGDPVMVPLDEDDWREDIDEMAERIEDDWEPPPVVVSHRDGRLILEDGNHRVEGLRRAGRDQAWAVIAFNDPDECDRFVVPDRGSGA